jgi:hypothetical protein
MRKCIKCKLESPVEEFYADKHTNDGISRICISCAKEKVSRYRKGLKHRKPSEIKRPDKKICYSCKLELPKASFFSDKGVADGLRRSCKQCDSKKNKKYRDSLIGRYWAYNNKSGKKFSLTLEQFEKITSQPCFYCGEFTDDKNHTGIDRKDNSKGYESENCLPCCAICNRMKRDQDKKSFFKKVKLIYEKRNLSS